jgi:hypothetical protein
MACTCTPYVKLTHKAIVAALLKVKELPFWLVERININVERSSDLGKRIFWLDDEDRDNLLVDMVHRAAEEAEFEDMFCIEPCLFSEGQITIRILLNKDTSN